MSNLEWCKVINEWSICQTPTKSVRCYHQRAKKSGFSTNQLFNAWNSLTSPWILTSLSQSVVPLSVHFLIEPKMTKESIDEQFRTFTLIGDLCDNLHAQSVRWLPLKSKLLVHSNTNHNLTWIWQSGGMEVDIPRSFAQIRPEQMWGSQLSYHSANGIYIL